jgi:serine/threonine protein phosphatase PrpC
LELLPVVRREHGRESEVTSHSVESGTQTIVLTEADRALRVVQRVGRRAAMLTRRSPAKTTVNEDACAIIPVDDQRWVLVVADGCGGMARGELAARLAIDAVRHSIAKNPDHESLRSLILDAIETANREILDRKIGAATTLAIAEYDDGTMRTYHVGDSQVLLIGGRGKIKLKTAPHSPVGFAARAGILSEEEAMNHDDRHIVSNVVGCEEMKIEIGPPKKMAPRDTIVLGTDGLFDNLQTDEIAATATTAPIAAPIAAVAESLERQVDSRVAQPEVGKADDLALIVFRAA